MLSGVDTRVAGSLLVILLASCVQTGCNAQEVCIAPEDGSQTPPSCERTTTLDQFCSAGVPDDVAVTFLNGTHRLSVVCEMKNIKNVTFSAEVGSKVTIHCNKLGTGLKYLNVSMLKISDIEFTDCRADWNDMPLYQRPFKSSRFDAFSLFFIGGSNISLTNVRMSSFLVYNVAGDVAIDYCSTDSSGNLIAYDNLTHTAAVSISKSNVAKPCFLLPLSRSCVSTQCFKFNRHHHRHILQ